VNGSDGTPKLLPSQEIFKVGLEKDKNSTSDKDDEITLLQSALHNCNPTVHEIYLIKRDPSNKFKRLC
jgi:hypothetical protein